MLNNSKNVSFYNVIKLLTLPIFFDSIIPTFYRFEIQISSYYYDLVKKNTILILSLGLNFKISVMLPLFYDLSYNNSKWYLSNINLYSFLFINSYNYFQIKKYFNIKILKNVDYFPILNYVFILNDLYNISFELSDFALELNILYNKFECVLKKPNFLYNYYISILSFELMLFNNLNLFTIFNVIFLNFKLNSLFISNLKGSKIMSPLIYFQSIYKKNLYIKALRQFFNKFIFFNINLLKNQNLLLLKLKYLYNLEFNKYLNFNIYFFCFFKIRFIRFISFILINFKFNYFIEFIKKIFYINKFNKIINQNLYFLKLINNSYLKLRIDFFNFRFNMKFKFKFKFHNYRIKASKYSLEYLFKKKKILYKKFYNNLNLFRMNKIFYSNGIKLKFMGNLFKKFNLFLGNFLRYNLGTYSLIDWSFNPKFLISFYFINLNFKKINILKYFLKKYVNFFKNLRFKKNNLIFFNFLFKMQKKLKKIN